MPQAAVIIVNGISYGVTDTQVDAAVRLDEARSKGLMCGFTDRFGRPLFINPERVEVITASR